MRVLQDTHTLLWADANDPRLSRVARATMEDESNAVVLSAVTVLEIAIKYSQGRLDLDAPAEAWVTSRMASYRLEELPVSVAHAVQVAALPHHHRDPFDRLLVAQAQVEGLPIVTSDENIARYGVEVIW